METKFTFHEKREKQNRGKWEINFNSRLCVIDEIDKICIKLLETILTFVNSFMFDSKSRRQDLKFLLVNELVNFALPTCLESPNMHIW